MFYKPFENRKFDHRKCKQNVKKSTTNLLIFTLNTYLAVGCEVDEDIASCSKPQNIMILPVRLIKIKRSKTIRHGRLGADFGSVQALKLRDF